MNRDQIKSLILSLVKPLKTGHFVSQDDQGQAALDNLFPNNGFSDTFRNASPFGFISGVPKGVAAFYQSVMGSGFETVILNHLHKLRPSVAKGQTVLYSTTADGQTIKCTIKLNADGTLVIDAPVKVSVTAPAIELGAGALEKVIKGETFMQFFNQHTHLGNLGAPTGPPQAPMSADQLSTVVKSE